MSPINRASDSIPRPMWRPMLRLTALGALLCAGAATAQQPGAAPGITSSLLFQNRPDDAMRSLEAHVGTNPFDAVSMNNLAVVKASRNDWYGAAELLARAHRLAPDNGIIGGNLSQLNEFLASRMTPSAKPVTAAQNLPEGAVWPEPPALWQSGPRP